jgi:hypothetical protein
MATTVEDALQQGKLFTDDQTYTFLQLPVSSVSNAATAVSNSSYFRGLLVDKDEITLMITSQDYAKEKDALGENVEVGEFSYRMITFDAVLAPTLIGFMATITKALAAAEISVLPFAAYSRDHIFVQEGDFEKAMQVLEGLASKK